LVELIAGLDAAIAQALATRLASHGNGIAGWIPEPCAPFRAGVAHLLVEEGWKGHSRRPPGEGGGGEERELVGAGPALEAGGEGVAGSALRALAARGSDALHDGHIAANASIASRSRSSRLSFPDRSRLTS